MENIMNFDEFLDVIDQTITLNCSIPRLLNIEALKRITLTDALPFFYKNYRYANQRTYYYVDLIGMSKNKSTGTSFFYLPSEIESISQIYMVGYKDMFNLGYILPKNSMNMANTTQSYVASLNLTEQSQSVAVMQSFQDALSTFSKNTLKFSFDHNSKRFEILTSNDKNLILETKAHTPQEFLFTDPLFIKYVTGQAFTELGMKLKFDTITLAGNSTINGDVFYERGTALVTEVKETIDKMKTPTFFINRTK